MLSTSRNVLSILWVLCVIVLAAYAVVNLSTGGRLRSNVFELLPSGEYDPVAAVAIERAESEISGQFVLLIGHTDRAVAEQATRFVTARLDDEALISNVAAETSADDAANFARFYFAFRQRLLTEKQVSSIESDAGLTVERNALAALFSPLASTNSASLLADPFTLFPESLAQVRPRGGELKFDDGLLWAENAGVSYVLIVVKTGATGLGINAQRRLVDAVETTLEDAQSAYSDLDVLRTGYIFYADAGTESARSEISLVGSGSIIGILALMLWAFRSAKPIVLALLTVLVGIVVAIGVTFFVFGSVHLFTLVFGASLIGVSIDYAFHYLAEAYVAGSDWTPQAGLHRILPGITLGLLTSVVAYLALTVAPFPGLKQLAIFSAAGLVGAYLTLLLWANRLPVAVGGERQREPLLRIGAWYVGLWQRMSAIHRACVVAVIIVVSTYGVSKLDVNDNVSVLQSRPDNLLSQERAIADILGAIPSNTFLLLRAATDEQLLQLEERVRVTLDEAIADDNLYDYLAVSRAVPSLARQVRSSLAYDQVVRHRLPGFLAELGLPDDEINAVAADFTAATSPLTVDQWLDDPASATSRRLWIGAVEGVYASIVLLEGVEDSAAIRAAMSQHPGVEVVDQAADLSVLLGAYRNRVTVLLAGAYVVIWLLLAIRFGLRRSAILVLPPVLAGFAALGAGAAFGYSLNLFNMLALILVLGIGIDFTLFIAEARESLTGTAFAITLSALTTILSFGLLAVSATYAVSAFGFTVLVGIAGAYLLAPMAVHVRTFGSPQ